MDSSKSSRPASTVEASETTPLLNNTASKSTPQWPKSLVYRVLFTAFLVSLTFAVTQVPIVYIFGLMTCDEYYKTHPDPGPGPDRCKVAAIQAGTGSAIALLGFSTTFFGVINLFVTGWTIKVFGIKKALLISVFWPSVRLLVQNVGVFVGAGTGALIVQLSQIMTIIGGPAGYMLALNSYATEIVTPSERTAALGRLQGCAMFGPAVGMLAGGFLGEFDIKLPFQITLVLFLISSLYVFTFLPEIPLNKEVEAKASKSLAAFFEPIKMFAPRKWVLKSGTVKKEYGILLLGIGVALGVLATSYVPTLLQMYGTDEFDFGTTENGWVVSINCGLRGVFLTFAFPAIISGGRKWLDKPKNEQQETLEESIIPVDADQVVPPADSNLQPEPVETAPQKPEQESYKFDLFFTRYSLILDGLLTSLGTFMTEGWQMYALACVLPLGSGTGSSAKGVILQMCSPEQKTDALNAISLVEMASRMCTTAVFGLIFSAFASIGRLYMVFVFNAGVAVVGFLILLFARFPPDGSYRLKEDEPEQEDS